MTVGETAAERVRKLLTASMFVDCPASLIAELLAESDGYAARLAAMQADMAALLAERDVLAAQVEAVKALHVGVWDPYWEATLCRECTPDDEDGDLMVPWPCSTAQALGVSE